ncbi:hypothetical protein CLOSTHATH_06249, partial [Hungatella hathewayi DSM 13479]
EFFQHMFQIVYTDRLISPFLQMPLYGSADHLIILYNQYLIHWLPPFLFRHLFYQSFLNFFFKYFKSFAKELLCLKAYGFLMEM